MRLCHRCQYQHDHQIEPFTAQILGDRTNQCPCPACAELPIITSFRHCLICALLTDQCQYCGYRIWRVLDDEALVAIKIARMKYSSGREVAEKNFRARVQNIEGAETWEAEVAAAAAQHELADLQEASAFDNLRSLYAQACEATSNPNLDADRDFLPTANAFGTVARYIGTWAALARQSAQSRLQAGHAAFTNQRSYELAQKERERELQYNRDLLVVELERISGCADLNHTAKEKTNLLVTCYYGLFD